MKHNKRCNDCGRFRPSDEMYCDWCGYDNSGFGNTNALMPLVSFNYKKPDGVVSARYVRVTRMNGKYLEGFQVEYSDSPIEHNNFRRFKVDRMHSFPILEEYGRQ